MTGSDARYTKPWYLATYLEMEWSDYLLSTDVEPSDILRPVQPQFYQRVVGLVTEWLKRYDQAVQRYCDVGGATGRMLYELVNRLPSISEAVLAEPSSQFCAFARQLLFARDRQEYIPIVSSLHDPLYRNVQSWPAPLEPSTRRRVDVYEVSSHQVPRPRGFFDLVTCLNVVDRVSRPLVLLQDLARLTRPRGLLVIASPMDFEVQFTPDEGLWLSDIREGLAEVDWEILETTDCLYEVRPYTRKRIAYDAQVVLARRREPARQ